MKKSSLLIITLAGLMAAAAQAQEAMPMSMSMSTTPAAENLRDPHAYSGGYTLTDGPYAQPGPRQLSLADEENFWAILGNRLEYQPDSDTAVFDLQAWYGNSYDKLVLKAEGELAQGKFEQSATQMLWGHAISTYFDTQLGLQFEQFSGGESRQWLALGVQGLAPYWFELDLTAYVGQQGRTALSAELDYELLLTQKLILQPRVEFTIYGKDDPQNALGAGLSNVTAGLRLRYEFSRQFAPYIGVEWSRFYGNTAELREQGALFNQDTQFLAGVRFWF